MTTITSTNNKIKLSSASWWYIQFTNMDSFFDCGAVHDIQTVDRFIFIVENAMPL